MLLFQNGAYNATGDLVGSPVFPPDIPTAPDLYEKLLGKSPSGPAWDAYLSLVTIRSLGKPLLIPPGATDSIKRVFWDAAVKMGKDQGFIEISEKLYGVRDECSA